MDVPTCLIMNTLTSLFILLKGGTNTKMVIDFEYSLTTLDYNVFFLNN